MKSSQRNAFLEYLRIVPLTIAVGFGPFLDAIYNFMGKAEMEGGGVSLAQIERGALSLAMILAMPLMLPHAVRRNRISYPLLAMALFAIATSGFHENPFAGIVYAMRLIFVCLVLINAYEFTRRGVIHQLWLAIVGFMVIFTVIGSQLAGLVLGVTAYGTLYSLPGITGQPATPSASLISVFPVFLRKVKLRLIDSIGIILIFLSIIGTLRRTALLAIILALSVFLFIRMMEGHRLIYKVRAILVVTLVMVISYFVLVNTPLGEVFQGRFGDLIFTEGGTASGRTQFMPIALDHIFSRDAYHFILGDGFEEIKNVLFFSFGAAIGSHNDWLDITVALGIVGFFLFLWFHLEILKLAFRTSSENRACAFSVFCTIAFLAVASGGVFDPSLAPIYALLGMIIAQNEEKKDESLEGVSETRYRFAL